MKDVLKIGCGIVLAVAILKGSVIGLGFATYKGWLNFPNSSPPTEPVKPVKQGPADFR